MSSRRARHARPSRATTLVPVATLGGSLLLSVAAPAAWAQELLPPPPTVPLPAEQPLPVILPAPEGDAPAATGPAPSEQPEPAPEQAAAPEAAPGEPPTAAQTSPAAAPAHPPAGLDRAATDRLYAAVDRMRAAQGLPELRRHAGLQERAVAQSRAMAEKGRLWHAASLFTRASRSALGMSSLGETVATAGDVDAAFRTLLASPRHRAILETASFRSVGLAVVNDGAGAVWVTQDFGAPGATAAAAAPLSRRPTTAAAARHLPPSVPPPPVPPPAVLARQLRTAFAGTTAVVPGAGRAATSPGAVPRRPDAAPSSRSQAAHSPFSVGAGPAGEAVVAALDSVRSGLTAALRSPSPASGDLPLAPPLFAVGMLVLGAVGVRSAALSAPR